MASSKDQMKAGYTLMSEDSAKENDSCAKEVSPVPKAKKPIPAVQQNNSIATSHGSMNDSSAATKHVDSMALSRHPAQLGDEGRSRALAAAVVSEIMDRRQEDVLNSNESSLPSLIGISQGSCQRESKVSFKEQQTIELQELSEGASGGRKEQVDDEQLLLGGPNSKSLRNTPRPRPPPLRKLQRLQSSLNLDGLSRNEIELKANLYFHIGNPIKRWKVDRVVPLKLLLQLLKTFCLIVQVILFTFTIAHQRSDFFYNSRVIFESLFIKNFQDGITEPRDYYTSYSIQDMFRQFEHISEKYFSLPEITIGGYGFESTDRKGDPTPITMELSQFKIVELNTVDNTYKLNGDINKTRFSISKGDNATEVYLFHSQDRLFHRFVSLVIRIPVRNIRIVHPERMECFLFNVTITYTNEENIGKIQYLLEESHARLPCNGDIETETKLITATYGALTALDVMVIGMCLISIILTAGSLRRGLKLAKAMRKFYLRELGIKLKWWEVRSLFPLWHLLNTLSDLLIITGSLYKIFLEYGVGDLDNANPTNLLLGIAVLLQAGVFLRYVSYFKQLNALTRTITLAFPELMKFLICAGVLFLAFVINGWIILGPYHPKFFTFHATLDTLYGLINGDDIYGTFIGIDEEDDIFAYVYSRIYIYVFLALFLYFVLNLFTSLVISAHEASQTYDTAYENEVRRFVFSGPLTPRGAALRDVTRTKNYVDPEVIRKRLKGPLPSQSSKSTGESCSTDIEESYPEF